LSNSYIVAQLNARLQPMDRGEYFEDPLDEVLLDAGLGEVSGGGTMQSESGEIEYCDIEIQVTGDPAEVERIVIENLVKSGAPKGSKLIIESEDREVPFGDAEGLGVYLNGTDLPKNVYAECDSNFVYTEFNRLLEGVGSVLSFWQGPTETALYMYGTSFQEMQTRLTPFLESYPLCAKARVVRIA